MFLQAFTITDFNTTKQQLLDWANQFGSCCFLDNHQYQSAWQQQECLLAVGVHKSMALQAGNALPALQAFIDEHKGHWFFGHLGFGLQAETEQIPNPHTEAIGFDDLYFFIPEAVITLTASQLTIQSVTTQPTTIWQQVQQFKSPAPVPQAALQLQERLSKPEYIATIEQLRQHILRGDCYEINFCQEFFAENAQVDTLQLFKSLSGLSPNPFSCYYKVNEAHLMCASPERYMMRQGDRIYSQPIKGTAARNHASAQQDAEQSRQLQASAKDRSENVMVVDLVRNDLSKICRQGTVQVDELFGIYTYPHVHQMISTISGELLLETDFAAIVQATFPMGSMTGAPKKKVLELTTRYETGARGLFSGAVGYIAPNGNFDFNVVIRSVLYNAATRYLSYQVGGGITWYSQAEKEYEECLIKAAAIRQVLS